MSDTIWAALIALCGTGGFSGILYRLHRESLRAFRLELAAERESHVKAARLLADKLERTHDAQMGLLARLNLCPILKGNKQN